MMRVVPPNKETPRVGEQSNPEGTCPHVFSSKTSKMKVQIMGRCPSEFRLCVGNVYGAFSSVFVGVVSDIVKEIKLEGVMPRINCCHAPRPACRDTSQRRCCLIGRRPWRRNARVA